MNSKRSYYDYVVADLVLVNSTHTYAAFTLSRPGTGVGEGLLKLVGVQVRDVGLRDSTVLVRRC